jgi:putative polyhydroxyalkanoate system protein
MSDIHIRRHHALPIADARKAAEKVARQLEKDFDLAYEWQGHVLHFSRSGVQGELHVTDREVRIDAKLGLLLGFLKARIEAEVEENLDKLFGKPGTAPAKPASKEHATKPPAKAGAKTAGSKKRR